MTRRDDQQPVSASDRLLLASRELGRSCVEIRRQRQPWQRVSRCPCVSSWRRRCWRRARRSWLDRRTFSRGWRPPAVLSILTRAGSPTSPTGLACAPPPSSWRQINHALVCRSGRRRKSKRPVARARKSVGPKAVLPGG
ncbi:uncharacterized protein LOC125026437 [Penaeus chinensis]|uniref:uncharacterized protein LOC125026437 n=1 Tax=Penaeus chinensis TaxID=139456 RepID=UPI001FB710AF|nr:uncharacterized protein LOC125026437 [Penaeus chinensis]